jgi:hypothetical protein
MRDWLLALAIIAVGAFAGFGLAMGLIHSQDERPRSREASWDQENLKRHDNGCPTAIYTVINGKLIQCPPYSTTE